MADKNGVCAIIPRNQQGFRPRVFGMGILVTPRDVLTCFHVIDESLGADWQNSTDPALVRVCFPLAKRTGWIEGEVDKKCSIPPGRFDDGQISDVAVIRLLRIAPPLVGVAELTECQAGDQVKAYGFRSREVNGELKFNPDGEWAVGTIVGPQPGERGQFDGVSNGTRVEKGYSGGGVYSITQNCIIGMVVETGKDPSQKIAQFINVRSAWEEVRKRRLNSHDSIPEFPAPPHFNPSDRIVKLFVGRGQDIDRVRSVLRRQKIRQKSRPRPGTNLFWYHGFGGLGKSWLLRRIAHLSSKPSRNQSAAVLLVDWNPNDTWSPLKSRVSNPELLFKAIAIRATQVYGRELVRPFWDKWSHFRQWTSEWSDLADTRFQEAIRLVATGSDSLERPHQPGTDIFPVKLVTPRDAHDRDVLREVLQQRELWSEDKSQLAGNLSIVKVNGPVRDEVYEAWATIVVSQTDPDHSILVNPFHQLANTLRYCLSNCARSQPLLLLLDTCEELTEWTEHWLRRLLVPLLETEDPVVLVVGGRSRPDRYQRPGQKDGWLNQLPGQIEGVLFDQGRFFTVTEIEELLMRSKKSVPGVDQTALASRLHIVTRGVPFGLGLLIDRFSDLLKEVAALEDLGGKELDNSKAAERVNEELAARYLLHVKSVRDREDIYLLALLPGLTEDSERGLDWYLRSRRWGSASFGQSDATERFRDRILAAIWGESAWRERLQEIERSYGLVANGDLHSMVRHSFRSRWRNTPPDGLSKVIDKLASGLESLRPSEGVYDEYWVAWTATRLGIEGWRAKEQAAKSLIRAIVVGLTHGQDVDELHLALSELGGGADKYRPFVTGEEINNLDAMMGQSTEFEKACLAVLKALADIEESIAQHSPKKNRLLASAKLLAANLEIMWAGLPSYQQSRIADAYLTALFRGTFNNRQTDLFKRAAELSKTLPLPTVGSWWGFLLHNEHLYEESCTELRKLLQAEPANEHAAAMLAHNLADHLGETEEALTVLETALEAHRYGRMRLCCMKGDLLARVGRASDALSFLQSELTESRIDLSPDDWRADCHVKLGDLYLSNKQLHEALREFEKAFELDSNNEGWIGYAAALNKSGKSEQSKELIEAKLNRSNITDNENVIAWKLYLYNLCLDEAERLAALAFNKSNEKELKALQTLMAVQVRAGRWDAADQNVRRYFRKNPVGDIVGRTWKQEILFFRDSIANGRESWVADRIMSEAPKDDRWEVIRYALTGEPDFPSHLRAAIQIVSEQFRSEEPNPTFPTIGSASAV